MTTQTLQTILLSLLSGQDADLTAADAFACEGESLLNVDRATSFASAGVMTNNNGIVLRMEDGSEFQINIVQSRA